MNKLQKLIKSLEDNYNVNIDNLVKDYADKLSVEVMASNQNVKSYVITTILQHLQLKRPKNKRDTCVKEHYAMLSEETLDDYTIELEDENEEMFNTIQKLEKSLYKSKTELNLKRKMQRKVFNTEALQERILEGVTEVFKDKDLTKVGITLSVPLNKETDEGLLVVLSDHHIGEVVGNGVLQNTFNYDEAIKRLDLFLGEVIMFPKQSKKITVAQCGDTLRGLIHGGLYQSEDSFIESISKAVDYYVYIYNVLSEIYDEVEVYSITGNHDRVTEDPKTIDKALDFTRLVDKLVAKQINALGIRNVKIYITDVPYQLISVNKANVLLFHGDTVRNYKAHDANQRSLLQDLCLGMFKKPYLHAISGHTHSFEACHNQYGGMNIVNGTLVGTNTYGIANGMRDICASQTICFIDVDSNLELIKAVKLN